MPEAASYGFRLVLVNAVTAHALKRKESVRLDAARLAELLQYGLLQGSFVPPGAMRDKHRWLALEDPLSLGFD